MSDPVWRRIGALQRVLAPEEPPENMSEEEELLWQVKKHGLAAFLEPSEGAEAATRPASSASRPPPKSRPEPAPPPRRRPAGRSEAAPPPPPPPKPPAPVPWWEEQLRYRPDRFDRHVDLEPQTWHEPWWEGEEDDDLARDRPRTGLADSSDRPRAGGRRHDPRAARDRRVGDQRTAVAISGQMEVAVTYWPSSVSVATLVPSLTVSVPLWLLPATKLRVVPGRTRCRQVDVTRHAEARDRRAAGKGLRVVEHQVAITRETDRARADDAAALHLERAAAQGGDAGDRATGEHELGAAGGYDRIRHRAAGVEDEPVRTHACVAGDAPRKYYLLGAAARRRRCRCRCRRSRPTGRLATPWRNSRRRPTGRPGCRCSGPGRPGCSGRSRS